VALLGGFMFVMFRRDIQMARNYENQPMYNLHRRNG
jgi:hypothetical protein